MWNLKESKQENRILGRKYAFYFLTLLIFSTLLIRLFYLQIYSGKEFYHKAEENRVRQVSIEPVRGLVFDRTGKLLVDNKPAYSVLTIPFEVKKLAKTTSLLSRVLGLRRDYIVNKVENVQSSPFVPVKLKRETNFQQLSILEEYKLELPGVIFSVEPKRSYPSAVRASHIFGYLGEITEQELAHLKKKGYRMGDIVGKAGIERRYDDNLRGRRGYSFVEVDALGREIRTLAEKKGLEPVAGSNLYLTIDADLQAFAEEKFEGLRGGIVVLDPRNGEILAMVSKPDYEPRLLTGVIPTPVWRSLQDDPGHPLFNRVTQGTYPPGSTFKLVLAAAGIETGAVDENWTINCPGYFRFGWRYFNCWKRGGHGKVSLLRAIEVSCNVYFYQLGLKVGLDEWSRFAQAFGFGRKTGIDLPEENAGFVPTREFLKQKYGEGKWPRGIMLNLAVGQGDLSVTPLQMACLAGIIATGGKFHRPHLVRAIENPISSKKVQTEVDSATVEGVSSATFELMREGMRRVVNGAHGTGRAAKLAEIEIAGKTGTAQNPHGKDHAWFIGFAPYQNPQVALSIVVEHGGAGGAVAAPLARAIFTKFFSKNQVLTSQRRPLQTTTSAVADNNSKGSINGRL